MDDITDVDYWHAKRVLENFDHKSLGDYHDLYVQSEALSLPNLFWNFRNKCIEICELHSAHSLSAPWLALQTCLKKTEVKLELLTDINMLLMAGKEIRGEIYHALYRYAKARNNYMQNYDRTIRYSVFRCKQFAWMGNDSKISGRWF